MRAYVGVTDLEWFLHLSGVPSLEEVNFWQPGGNRKFGALESGELFLFKLHSPRNYIVGGGLFAHSSLLPVSLAWEAFGRSNGAGSLAEMRERVQKYRRCRPDAYEDYTIGCIILTQPFYFSQSRWIPVPPDWSRNIVQGKRYDLTKGPGAVLLEQVQKALVAPTEYTTERPEHRPAIGDPSARYGSPISVVPRLGQGAFRIVVTDAYQRRCSVTGERVLPVLEAAHIRPYASGGTHELPNGLLLRRDLHTLLDQGYVTVTTDHHFEVGGRIRDEYENGRDYYALHGKEVQLPVNERQRPSKENLIWHNENVFRG